jgi:hypothetical protein
MREFTLSLDFVLKDAIGDGLLAALLRSARDFFSPFSLFFLQGCEYSGAPRRSSSPE